MSEQAKNEMAPADQLIRNAIEELNKRPCQCVTCSACGGTGNIRVSYDGRGRRCEAFGDDLDDLETCDQCHAGITETCERCLEMEELEQSLEEMNWRRAG